MKPETYCLCKKDKEIKVTKLQYARRKNREIIGVFTTKKDAKEARG